MRRLRLDEQFIDLQASIFRKRAQVRPEFDDREEVERFLGRHGVSVGQNSVRATDLIQKRVWLFLKQYLSRVVLLFDDCFNYFAQATDDFFFLLAKRGLI